jgi:hypothetical protein
MLTEETAARIDYGLACIQLAQRLRDLPADHPLAIEAREAGIEPITDPGPPSLTLIARYGGLSKSTFKKYESVARARAKRSAIQLGIDPKILSLKTES